LYSFDQLKA
jgi:hypothetical protein